MDEKTKKQLQLVAKAFLGGSDWGSNVKVNKNSKTKIKVGNKEYDSFSSLKEEFLKNLNEAPSNPNTTAKVQQQINTTPITLNKSKKETTSFGYKQNKSKQPVDIRGKQISNKPINIDDSINAQKLIIVSLLIAVILYYFLR